MKYFAAFGAIIFGFLALMLSSAYLEFFWGIIPTEIPIVLDGTLEYFETKYELIGQDTGIVIIVLICVVLCSFFYALYHRLNKKKKDILDKDQIKSPFVLYLRSFIDDQITKRRVSFLTDVRTEEEVLVEVMSDIAPVYAIGDPKDKKMPLGASRIYVDDAHWKSTVEELAQRAVLVVLRLGKTDSFWWEVEMSLKKLSVDKILFVVPESKTFSNVANLYKILLEHDINIQSLDVNIEKKFRGSISSFVFFDKNGNPKTQEVQAPRFTRMILSYENMLRNALSDFRLKYGFRPVHKRTLKLTRVFTLLYLMSFLIIVPSKCYKDQIDLQYQMPYELVNECVNYPEYVEKYSNTISMKSLTSAINESRKGVFALDDDEYKLLFLIKARTVASMSSDELLQSKSSTKNMLLMVKKYRPDDYDTYVRILAQAAITAIRAPENLEERIQAYKANKDAMPQWVLELENSKDNLKNQKECMMKYYDMVEDHLDDEDIVDILKTLASQSYVIPKQ